ncbi:MAG: Tex family protein [Bdellovibrionota bacterium]
MTTAVAFPLTKEFFSWFSPKHPGINARSVEVVSALVAEGSTVPFMARYRKEQTGNLDEVQIQAVIDGVDLWKELLKRQDHILKEIEKQEKLTDALKSRILACFDLDLLEDIYLPFKLKRKTKAMIAKEAGLEPLALGVWQAWKGEAPAPAGTLELRAAAFVDAAKKLPDVAAVIQGVSDILIEKIAEDMELRVYCRDTLWKEAFLKSTKGAKAKTPSKFDKYFDYSESLQSLLRIEASHRYLAMRRGWMEEELSLSLSGAPGAEDVVEARILEHIQSKVAPRVTTVEPTLLAKAIRLAYRGYILTSLSNEIHKNLKDSSDTEAIKVFSNNVRQVLMSPPLGSKTVVALDPGIRTGVKVAIVDETGSFKDHTVMYLQHDTQKAQSLVMLLSMIKKFKAAVIAVGNGTAGRETEIFVRQSLKGSEFAKIPVVMVNESGASIYSASEVARKEFPDLDITVRGAISIGRRLQDPLAELVKIDPKSIGVGQYQHDVSQPALKKSIEAVVDSCVNQVGVNLNTASEYLLARVSGIGPALAKGIVKFREDKGLFKSRKELLSVPRLSEKIFEQAAGFLRVPESSNPLDNTGVHPERYAVLEKYATQMGVGLSDLVGVTGVSKLKTVAKQFKEEVGEFSFKDIMGELEKPGRDPRESFESVEFREDIMELKDLKPDMMCPGVVTNVTNFGAFVDIGVHQDGLVHISQLSDNFVKDPKDVVQPGQRVTVKVLSVDLSKNQIALSMKTGAQAARPAPGDRPQQHQQGGGARPLHPGGARPQGGSGSRPRQDDDFANNPFAKLAGLIKK